MVCTLFSYPELGLYPSSSLHYSDLNGSHFSLICSFTFFVPFHIRQRPLHYIYNANLSTGIRYSFNSIYTFVLIANWFIVQIKIDRLLFLPVNIWYQIAIKENNKNMISIFLVGNACRMTAVLKRITKEIRLHIYYCCKMV